MYTPEIYSENHIRIKKYITVFQFLKYIPLFYDTNKISRNDLAGKKNKEKESCSETSLKLQWIKHLIYH